MVLVKALGFFDLICAILFLLTFFGVGVVWWLKLTFGIYLLAKCLIFIKNFVSILDGVIGIVLLLSLLWQLQLISGIIALYLGLKAAASLR